MPVTSLGLRPILQPLLKISFAADLGRREFPSHLGNSGTKRFIDAQNRGRLFDLAEKLSQNLHIDRRTRADRGRRLKRRELVEEFFLTGDRRKILRGCRW